MLDTIVFAIVTKNICCGGIKLKTIRYNLEELREHFDNNNNSVSAIVTIKPIIVAMFLSFNFSIMLWLATLGNTIDNIFYIFVYYKTLKMSVNEMTEIRKWMKLKNIVKKSVVIEIYQTDKVMYIKKRLFLISIFL